MKTNIGIIFTILIAMFVAIPLVRANGETSYSSTLRGPNVSMAAATIPGTPIKAGDSIRLVGSGTFDPSTGSVSGGGAFTYFNPDGTVFARGIWTVKEFVSFNSYGGPNPGMQGGLLKIIIDIIAPEAKFTLMMQISSLVNAPGGAPAEGVTIWTPDGAVPLFGVVVSGRTLFHLSE